MLKTIQRRTEVYSIYINEIGTRKVLSKPIVLDKILRGFFSDNLYKEQKNEIKFDIKKKNKIFWIDFFEEDKGLLKIKIDYALYNKKQNIIDINNLRITKKKYKNEGIDEKQHIVVKLYKNKNIATLVFEKVVNGISISNIEDELIKYIERKSEKGKYELNIKPVPNQQFVEELLGMKRISLMKITVDREKLENMDEDIMFAENNISRKDFDIIYKPTFGSSFSKKKIRKYYENVYGDKIKRIVLEGKNTSGKIRLDTEGARLSKYIETNLDLDGLIDTGDIFNKYERFIIEEFSDYLSNIVLDMDNNDEEE